MRDVTRRVYDEILLWVGAGGLIDLHVHSHFSSDADHSPRELLAMARDAGLRAIAIADHDVLRGYHEATRYSADYGVEVVPCVELTTFFADRELHLLAYLINTDADEVVEKLTMSRAYDEARAREVTSALRRMGVDCTYEEAQALTPHAVPKCSVIVRAAMINGRNVSLPLFEPYRTGDRRDQPYHNFFLDHMRPGGGAYVQPSADTFATPDAIAFVARNGGVAVLAHPAGSISPADRRAIIGDLTASGLRGLEVFSPYHSQDERQELADMCRRFDLVGTSGSDFHGATVKPGIALGNLPSASYAIVDRLRAS